jgi:hypothetical protein
MRIIYAGAKRFVLITLTRAVHALELQRLQIDLAFFAAMSFKRVRFLIDATE